MYICVIDMVIFHQILTPEKPSKRRKLRRKLIEALLFLDAPDEIISQFYVLVVYVKGFLKRLAIMEEHPNFFDQTLPTSEQAGMFARIFWHSLRRLSLQVLEGNAPITTNEKLDNASGVFWGGPRFLPGFVFHLDKPYVPNKARHVIAEYFTMAKVKKTLQPQDAGLNLISSPGLVQTYPHPFQKDGKIISMTCDLTFQTPEADEEKYAFVHFEVMTRQLNDSELHMSLEYVRFLWL